MFNLKKYLENKAVYIVRNPLNSFSKIMDSFVYFRRTKEIKN